MIMIIRYRSSMIINQRWIIDYRIIIIIIIIIIILVYTTGYIIIRCIQCSRVTSSTRCACSIINIYLRINIASDSFINTTYIIIFYPNAYIMNAIGTCLIIIISIIINKTFFNILFLYLLFIVILFILVIMRIMFNIIL
jgi:hypothetical protein